MAILEGRGLFWWGDEPIPAQQFAPNSSVTGLLTIDNDGSSSLELDGYLPSKHGPMAAMVQQELPAEKCIRGLLKGSGQHILLLGLVRNGGQMRSNGISYERYVGSSCFVSEREPIATKLTFKQLIVPLSGYEEWLRLRAIKVVQTRRTVSAKYKRPKQATYRLTNGSLTIDFDLGGPSSANVFGTEVLMKETASASLRFHKPLDLDGLKNQYQFFEDLLILLTDTDYALDWPWVAFTKTLRCRLYFTTLGDRTRATAPRYFECVVNFIQVRDRFGSIWETWRTKRDELGPALYLYLGTRRGMRLYVEHRFVNLVWGIEAFHRRTHADASRSALKEKVDRILQQINSKGDKKWLSKKLEHAHEPSLSERIFETISAVPLGLDAKRLRTFSDACAKARNDISHFGGLRHNGRAYNELMMELHDMSEALTTVYQMLLLHEIGIKSEILKWWVFEGFRSYPIKVRLAKVGLLDKSEVAPKPRKAKTPSGT